MSLLPITGCSKSLTILFGLWLVAFTGVLLAIESNPVTNSWWGPPEASFQLSALLFAIMNFGACLMLLLPVVTFVGYAEATRSVHARASAVYVSWGAFLAWFVILLGNVVNSIIQFDTDFFVNAEVATAALDIVAGFILLCYAVHSLVLHSKREVDHRRQPALVMPYSNGTPVRAVHFMLKLGLVAMNVWVGATISYQIGSAAPELVVMSASAFMIYGFLFLLAFLPFALNNNQPIVAAISFWVTASIAMFGWGVIIYAGRSTTDSNVLTACVSQTYWQCNTQAAVAAAVIILTVAETIAAVALAYFSREVALHGVEGDVAAAAGAGLLQAEGYEGGATG